MKYWCQTCGDLAPTANPFPWLPGTAYRHGPACPGVFIHSVEPLDVPEPTTWGESGGADAVCVSQVDSQASARWTRGNRSADEFSGFWWMFGPAKTCVWGDASTAINYVAGGKA